MVHSRKEEKACPYLLMQTSNLQGGEGDSESPDRLRGRKKEAPSLYSLPFLHFSPV